MENKLITITLCVIKSCTIKSISINRALKSSLQEFTAVFLALKAVISVGAEFKVI